MPLTVYLAATAVIGGMALLWWSLAGARSSVTRHVRGNLVSADLRQAFLQRSAHDRLIEPLIDALARKARRITPAGFTGEVERRIELAGMGGRWTVERVLATKLGLAIGGTMLGLWRVLLAPTMGNFALALAAILGGWMVPDFLLKLRGSERQSDIERAVPDTLDQLTICVEAGLGFDAALARIATTGAGPLVEELGHTLQDIRLGVPRARAFEELLERTDVRELRSFVHAVGQADRYGIPIAQILRVQAGEARQRRRQRAEERAMKIPVKLVFPVVLCILPALFVVLAGPAAVRLSHTSFGGG